MDKEKLLKLENTQVNLVMLSELYGLSYIDIAEMLGYHKSMTSKCLIGTGVNGRRLGKFAWKDFLRQLSEMECVDHKIRFNVKKTEFDPIKEASKNN